MANYKMTDLGDLSWCLDIQLTQGEDAIPLSQSTYDSMLLERFSMQDCKAIKTSSPLNFKKDFNLAGNLVNDTERQIYQILIGSLMWPMIGTRPHIAFAIVQLSKFVSKSVESIWLLLKEAFVI
jgi:hypothetical protein